MDVIADVTGLTMYNQSIILLLVLTVKLLRRIHLEHHQIAALHITPVYARAYNLTRAYNLKSRMSGRAKYVINCICCYSDRGCYFS